MRVTIEQLKDTAEDEDFLKANAQLLEKLAVHTLVDAMSGNAPIETKLVAASKVLDALGKSKPPALIAQPASVTNVQVNQFIPHMTEAMKGLSQVFSATKELSNVEES